MVNEVSIKDVVIGKRHRKDYRDVHSLATSIQAIGLLQPIVIDVDKVLVAGRRRIEAFKQLGRTKIPAHVIAIDDIVYGERDENMERLDFTPGEKVAIAEAVEAREAKAAKQRQSEAGGANPGKGASVKLKEAKAANETATRTAKTVGMSKNTFKRAKEVVAAAKAEPERFGSLLDEMNRTGRVNGVAKKLKVARQSDAIEAEAPPLPEGPFRVIVADPPWTYTARVEDASHRSSNP